MKLKFGKKLIKGGSLAGLAYEAVSDEKLKKAAKRYSGDPEFAKYARACDLLLDADTNAEPLACVPVQVKKDDVRMVSQINWSIFKKKAVDWMHFMWNSWLTRLCLLALALAFICRPSVSTKMARTVVSFWRMVLRRIINFLGVLIEGLMDEVIEQIDTTVRDALPDVAMPTDAKESFHFFSHIFSGLLGALIFRLTTQMYPPVQAG